jgi:hypothetical protein
LKGLKVIIVVLNTKEIHIVLDYSQGKAKLDLLRMLVLLNLSIAS